MVRFWPTQLAAANFKLNFLVRVSLRIMILILLTVRGTSGPPARSEPPVVSPSESGGGD